MVVRVSPRANPFSTDSSETLKTGNGSFEPLPEFEDPSTLFQVEQVTVSGIGVQAEAPQDGTDETTPLVQDAVVPQGIQGFSETDLMSLSEALWSIPSLVWNKIPQRTTEQLTPFNKALYIYCMRKGIDPYEYFFDEFPLVLAVIGVGGGIYRDYRDAYPKKDKNKTAEGDKDYEHQREVDEQRKQDFSGVD